MGKILKGTETNYSIVNAPFELAPSHASGLTYSSQMSTSHGYKTVVERARYPTNTLLKYGSVKLITATYNNTAQAYLPVYWQALDPYNRILGFKDAVYYKKNSTTGIANQDATPYEADAGSHGGYRIYFAKNAYDAMSFRIRRLESSGLPDNLVLGAKEWDTSLNLDLKDRWLLSNDSSQLIFYSGTNDINGTAWFASLDDFSNISTYISGISLADLPNKSALQIVTAMLSDLDMNYAQSESCSEAFLNSVSAETEERLKRIFFDKLANKGDNTYKAIRENMKSAITVNEFKLSPDKKIGDTSGGSYSEGDIKQYQIVINTSQASFVNGTSTFSSSGSQLIDRIMQRLKEILIKELINTQSGISALNGSVSSITSAFSSFKESASTTNHTRGCIDALLCNENTLSYTIDREEGVHDIYGFINSISTASDEGERIHHMLTTLSKDSGEADEDTMIYANDSTLYIGVRRALLETSSHDYDSDLVGTSVLGKTVSIATANSISELVKKHAIDSAIFEIAQDLVTYQT